MLRQPNAPRQKKNYTTTHNSWLLHGAKNRQGANANYSTGANVDNRLAKVQVDASWSIPSGREMQGNFRSWDGDVRGGCFAGGDIRCMELSVGILQDLLKTSTHQ